jgi:uncharacterized membrane protein
MEILAINIFLAPAFFVYVMCYADRGAGARTRRATGTALAVAGLALMATVLTLTRQEPIYSALYTLIYGCTTLTGFQLLMFGVLLWLRPERQRKILQKYF